MKSFTALILIAMLSIIGTVKGGDPSNINAVLDSCDALSNRCKNADDQFSARVSCICHYYKKQGHGVKRERPTAFE
ncbi:hypothetical protein CF328_g2191 [Tilletia controversa]|nr:hypothetical protein CF328_g2191 [Tilletia controversa]